MSSQEENKLYGEDVVERSSIHQMDLIPFPGLRPFRFEESHLFFGQDLVISKLIDKLLTQKFVCLLGGAGVGKTSIINCGIKPWLCSGLLTQKKDDWCIFHTQPGADPIKNLARSISSAAKDFFDENQRIQEQICYSVLHRGKSGIIELIDQLKIAPDRNFIFIIDQFEDLFRLRSNIDEINFFEESLHFVNLLVEALHSDKYNIHVIISIRSDFTDDCVMFPTLAEMINQSNVLVPKVSRDQLKQIILGPLRIANVKLEQTVLAQILNDAITVDDILPRLQYALKQTWGSWLSLHNYDRAISIKEYESGGGVKGAISSYANSLFDAFKDEDKVICEVIFKSLTERGSENKGLGRSATIKELSSIAKVETHDIIRVIEIFNKVDAGFLESDTCELSPTSVISLSHVSLMRAWDRLRRWVDDEAISGQMYKQLAESSAAYQIGKAGLLRPPDLQFAINWREKQNPTLAWARRYNPAFERTMVYLRTSLETYEAEEALKKLQARKAIRKIRSLSVVLGTTALLAILITIYAQILRTSAENQKKLALEQKDEADSKSVKAEKISKEALEDKLKAELAANEAEKTKLEALQETEFLSQQKSFAEVTAQEALKKTSETEKVLVEMTQEKQQYEQRALQANIQKTEAEKEKEEVLRKRMLTVSQAIAVKSFQLSGNKPLKSLLAIHSYEFNRKNGGADIHPDVYNALYSSLVDNGINLRETFKGHSGAVKSLCLNSRTNTLYSTGSDGKVLALNLNEQDASSQLIFKGSLGNLSLAISQNGKLLAVGGESGIIHLIDLTSPGGKPTLLKGHQGAVFSVVFSKDGQQLFSTGSDKKVLLWDLSTNLSTVVYNEVNTVRCVALSPDGKFLAGGADDGQILLWDIRNNQLLGFGGESGVPVYAISFNFSGTMLASGDLKGNIRLWNPFSRRLVKSFKSHSARVVDVKFGSNDIMVSSSYDGTAYIFDTRAINNAPIVLKEPSCWILSVALSVDSKRIILATNKPDFLVSWPSQTKLMADALCTKISRGLSSDEWNTYVGSDLKYEKPCE